MLEANLFAFGVTMRMLAGALLLALAIRCWRADNGHYYPWRWLMTAGVAMATWNGIGDLDAATDFWPGANLRLASIQWIGVPWAGIAAAAVPLVTWSRRRSR